MVNLPPDSGDRESQYRLRDSDEMVAIVVAILALGAVLFWGLTRGVRPVLRNLTSTGGLNQPLLSDDPLADTEGEIDSDRFSTRLDAFSASLETEQAPTETAAEEEAPLALSENDSRRVARRPAVTLPLPAPVDAADTADDLPAAVAGDPLAEDSEAEAVEEAGVAAAPSVSEDTAATPPSAGVEATPEAAVTTAPLDISDVPTTYWAYPYIASLYDQGLLPDFPDSQFQPDRQLTRAEFAALLSRSLVQAPSVETPAFSDVSDAYWAADAISQVVDAGYMSGYPDGTFKPDQLVPRYQVFVTLVSGLGLPQPGEPAAILSPFQGVQDLPGWSLGQVAAAAERRLVVNHPDPQNLAPQEIATRAQIAVMIHQALLTQGQVDAIESEFIVPSNQ